jgi:integrase
MSVKIRPYRNGGWEVDIVVTLPDGTRRRERRKAPVSTRSGALRWGRARERELLLHGPARSQSEVPTLAAFAPRFLEGYAVANRQKPSGIAAKETILRIHLLPVLGARKLDAITNEDIQRLKMRLRSKATKTVNNVLSVLNTLLRVAVEWRVIDRMPCAVRLLRMSRPNEAPFHDFEEYERLIEAAKGLDARAHLIVLLGGDAGLRCGEMMALEWTDVDLDKRMLWVRRSEWKGNVTLPKGGKARLIPMTHRLAKALRAYRHLRSPRVLCQDDGRPLTQKIVQLFVRRAARRANLPNGGVHILRHTFCSHLAMRGAPARAIQELAGHKDLSTSQRYMHLSPAAVEAAIRLLDEPAPRAVFGEIVETDDSRRTK